MTKKRVFLGVQTAARPDWQNWYSEPVVGSHYKEDTRKKKLAEKREQQEAKVGRLPYGAMAQTIHVVDEQGQDVLHFETGDGTYASVSFMDTVANLPDMLPEVIEPTGLHQAARDIGVNWFGFDIRDMMQVIAADVMYHNARTEGNKVPLPICMWYYKNFTPAPFVDPYDILVPSAMHGDITLDALCEYLNVSVPIGMINDARAKADVARQLVLAGQLIIPES
jgi:hypothetical protein